MRRRRLAYFGQAGIGVELDEIGLACLTVDGESSEPFDDAAAARAEYVGEVRQPGPAMIIRTTSGTLTVDARNFLVAH